VLQQLQSAFRIDRKSRQFCGSRCGIQPAYTVDMAGVRDHKELDVWKLCDEVRRKVRGITARPVFLKDLRLRNQLNDAAEGPCPNIGEGFSRYLPRDFARFVRIAKGSLTEVIEHMGAAYDKGFVSETDVKEVCSPARRGRGAATRLICYLESATAPHLQHGRKRPGRLSDKPRE